ncbi:MAG: hypothetical protein ACLQVD_06335, partial [Capsulimonadaceae bacterium]
MERPEHAIPSIAPHATESRLTTAIWGLIVFLATLACFASCWNFSYIDWDDAINITNNAHMNRPCGPEFAFYWLHPYLRVYRPLIYSIWSIIAVCSRIPPHTDPAVDGIVNFSPHAFHTVLIGIHAVDAVLLFFLLQLLFKRGAAAACGALLFALHPLQDESVAWITGGNLAYFGLFLFLALIHYVRFAMADDSRYLVSRRVHYALASVWFVCAALTYPLAIVIPIVAWVIDRAVLGRSVKAVSIAKVPWLVFAAAWTLVTTTVKHLDKAVTHGRWSEKPLVAGDAITFYLQKLLWPVNLTIDYGRTPEYVASHGWAYATAGIAVLFVGLLWLIRGRWPVAAAGGAVFVIGLLPTCGIVTNPFELYSTVADRYAYVALVGPAIVLSWALAVVPATRLRPTLAVTIVVLTMLGGSTI